jgi:hypothetical protein
VSPVSYKLGFYIPEDSVLLWYVALGIIGILPLKIMTISILFMVNYQTYTRNVCSDYIHE